MNLEKLLLMLKEEETDYSETVDYGKFINHVYSKAETKEEKISLLANFMIRKTIKKGREDKNNVLKSINSYFKNNYKITSEDGVLSLAYNMARKNFNLFEIEDSPYDIFIENEFPKNGNDTEKISSLSSFIIKMIKSSNEKSYGRSLKAVKRKFNSEDRMSKIGEDVFALAENKVREELEIKEAGSKSYKSFIDEFKNIKDPKERTISLANFITNKINEYSGDPSSNYTKVLGRLRSTYKEEVSEEELISIDEIIRDRFGFKKRKKDKTKDLLDSVLHLIKDKEKFINAIFPKIKKSYNSSAEFIRVFQNQQIEGLSEEEKAKIIEGIVKEARDPKLYDWWKQQVKIKKMASSSQKATISDEGVKYIGSRKSIYGSMMYIIRDFINKKKPYSYRNIIKELIDDLEINMKFLKNDIVYSRKNRPDKNVRIEVKSKEGSDATIKEILNSSSSEVFSLENIPWASFIKYNNKNEKINKIIKEAISKESLYLNSEIDRIIKDQLDKADEIFVGRYILAVGDVGGKENSEHDIWINLKNKQNNIRFHIDKLRIAEDKKEFDSEHIYVSLFGLTKKDLVPSGYLSNRSFEESLLLFKKLLIEGSKPLI